MTRVVQRGFTLIEMLISITLSLLLFGSFITIYLAAEKNYQQQITLNNMQTHANLAIQFLINDIHLAGYTACESQFIKNFIENGNSPTPRSDAVIIRHAGTVYTTVMSMPTSSILYVQPVRFKKGDSVIISDCFHTEIFVIRFVSLTTDGFQKITSEQPLKNVYAKNSELGRLDIHYYFIDKEGLYLQTGNNAKEEMVAGIKNLKIKYSVIQNGSLQELTANQVSNWQHVVGISFGLKLDGNNLLPDKWWYSYARLRCIPPKKD